MTWNVERQRLIKSKQLAAEFAGTQIVMYESYDRRDS